LRKHFTEFQIVEIMSVIAKFGYLNRWSDSMAMTLEEEPTAFAEQAMAGRGRVVGKHAAVE
jgi:hypothetical protein